MSGKVELMDLMNTKHVNLSLETAFVFDPKDSNSDVSMIKTLRSFLDTLQHAVSSKSLFRTFEAQGYYTLSNFLYDLGKHIIEYSDENIKRFAVALQTVVEDYYPSGTTFHKIIIDPRVKAFIKNSLKVWADTKPKVLRKGLQAMYRDETYDNVFVNLVKNLNAAFDEGDSKELKKYSDKFAKFPKTQKKLESAIDKTISYIVFDKYKTLNFTMKSMVLGEISKVSDYVIEAFKNRSVDPEFLLRKRTFENITVAEFASAENASKPELNTNDFSGSEREDVPKNPNDSLEKILKSSEEDHIFVKNVTDKNEIEKEIVLYKNLEIDVKNNAINIGNNTQTK